MKRHKSFTRRRQDENDYENARAKRAKLLFFIAKYAKLERSFCCRRRRRRRCRGCLNSLLLNNALFPKFTTKSRLKYGLSASASSHFKMKVPLTTGRRSKNSSGQLLRLRTAWDRSQFVTKRNKMN